jgi:hypothetical protein
MSKLMPVLFVLLAFTVDAFGSSRVESSQAATRIPTVINNDARADARSPSLAIDADGQVVIAWVEKTSGAFNAFVKRWDGKTWVRLGGSLNRNPKFNSFEVALALAPDGTPIAAWMERSNINLGKISGPGKIHTATWTGSSWQEFGPSPTKSPTKAADQPHVKIDSQGNPVLAWSELSADANAESFYVSRWDGSGSNGGGWQDIDIGTLSTDLSGASRSRDLAVTSKDEPILAWSVQYFEPGQAALGFNVYAGPWRDKHWAALGETSLNLERTHYAGAASMALDADDYPVIAWKEAKDGYEIHVKRWNGSSWQKIGQALNQGMGLGSAPKIALDQNGRPTVAWIENAGAENIFVARWDGHTWKIFGRKLNANPKAYATSSSMALDTAGNPVVVWSEEVGKDQQRIYGLRWTGREWVALETAR